MSELEVRQTEHRSLFELYAGGERVGDLSWLSRDEEDPEDFVEGWSAELWGSSLWSKRTATDPDITGVIAAARELDEERQEHEAKMARIDRTRPRTVSIPSGGQPPR
ncbi:hypothetical protein [Streptomyces sp. NPDC047525]|uniref:hypothetical protein n=1 Tax=Streptomyces sp. NPDC047525 TaxID=3155264 RepID=UPI0033FB6595